MATPYRLAPPAARAWTHGRFRPIATFNGAHQVYQLTPRDAFRYLLGMIYCVLTLALLVMLVAFDSDESGRHDTAP